MSAWRATFQFTIRELALCMVIAGLVLGWALDHHRLQGHLHHTGNPLDLAIDGEGYFEITDSKTSSIVYSRRGRFTLDDNGLLVTELQGVKRLLDPQICIPDNTEGIAVSPNGLVLAQVHGTSQMLAVGQFQFALFDDPSKLRQVADCVYAETVESGSPHSANPGTYGAGRVLQGVLDRRDDQKFSFSPSRR